MVNNMGIIAALGAIITLIIGPTFLKTKLHIDFREEGGAIAMMIWLWPFTLTIITGYGLFKLFSFIGRKIKGLFSKKNEQKPKDEATVKKETANLEF